MRAVYPQVGSGPGEPALDVVVAEPDRVVEADAGLVVHACEDDGTLHAGVTQSPEPLAHHRARKALPMEVRMRRDRLEVADAADGIGPRDRARRCAIIAPRNEVPPERICRRPDARLVLPDVAVERLVHLERGPRDGRPRREVRAGLDGPYTIVRCAHVEMGQVDREADHPFVHRSEPRGTEARGAGGIV